MTPNYCSYFPGLQSDFNHFVIFFLGLFFVSLAASSLAFFLSALVRIFAVANLLIAMCYVIMMVGDLMQASP